MDYVEFALAILVLVSLMFYSGTYAFRRLRFWFDNAKYATSQTTGVVVLNRVGLIDVETEKYFEVCRGVRGFRLALVSWLVKF
jgi:hypothetical protein